MPNVGIIFTYGISDSIEMHAKYATYDIIGFRHNNKNYHDAQNMRDTSFVNWQRVNSGRECLLESSIYINHFGWLVGQSHTY